MLLSHLFNQELPACLTSCFVRYAWGSGLAFGFDVIIAGFSAGVGGMLGFLNLKVYWVWVMFYLNSVLCYSFMVAM